MTASTPVELVCANPDCRKPFTLPGSQIGTYCSRACTGQARSLYRLDNELKLSFLAKVRAEHLSVHQVTIDLRLGRGTRLSDWLHARNAKLRRDGLEQVAAWLGLSVAEAEAMQGGSAERDMVRRANTISALRDPAMLQRHGRNVLAASRRGQSNSAEHRRKVAVAQRGRDLGDEWRENLRASLKMPRSRARHSLSTWLKHHPQPESAEVLAWAQTVSARLDQIVSQVIDWWRPMLRKRGITLPPRLGKASAAGKAAAIRGLLDQGMTSAQVAQEGIRRGQWDHAYVQVVLTRRRSPKAS